MTESATWKCNDCGGDVPAECDGKCKTAKGTAQERTNNG